MNERPETVIRSSLKDEQLDAVNKKEEVLTREQRKARLAVVLHRGIIHDRLHVQLPPNLHGEWVRADPLEIDRMRALGFDIDETYSSKRAIHADGSSGNRVGDVIFMTCDKEQKELIDEVRREQAEAANAPRGKKKLDREESEFASAVASSTGGEIPTFSESSTKKATLRDVLNTVDRQTAVQQ